jgi:penicillin amidase
VTNTALTSRTYLERADRDDEDEYETPTGPQPFDKRKETIRVKGAADVELAIRETRHGPVLSGLESIDKAFSHRRFVIALRWAALDPSDRTWAALHSLNHARSVEAAERALADFNVGTQSFVLADVDGNIDMVVAGRIPGAGWTTICRASHRHRVGTSATTGTAT